MCWAQCWRSWRIPKSHCPEDHTQVPRRAPHPGGAQYLVAVITITPTCCQGEREAALARCTPACSPPHQRGRHQSCPTWWSPPDAYNLKCAGCSGGHWSFWCFLCWRFLEVWGLRGFQSTSGPQSTSPKPTHWTSTPSPTLGQALCEGLSL